jgi:ketosteroid isomerase-like protein
MRLIRFLLLFLSIASSNLLADEAALTEASVNQMLNEVQAAVDEKSVSALAPYFTDDATITAVLPASMGGTSTVTKQQYLESLKQGWGLPAEYTYEIQNIEIEIAPDGQTAVATDVALETVAMNGKVVASSRTQETINIVLDNGSPRIKALRGEVEMQ